MFAVEVEIITDVIKYLNGIEVYVLYVYDGLLCEEKDKATVIETMNRIILKHGVRTSVKTELREESNLETESYFKLDEVGFKLYLQKLIQLGNMNQYKTALITLIDNPNNWDFTYRQRCLEHIISEAKK